MILDQDFLLTRLSSLSQVPSTRRVPSLLGEQLKDVVLRPAAVLVPLVQRAREPHVLLTKRQSHLSVHAGQVSFPGGRVDATDPSAEAAALREAHEEIGLEPRYIKPLGWLPTRVTTTGFEIKPLVGWIDQLPELTLSDDEVEEVFETPLSFFLKAENRHVREMSAPGVLKHVPKTYVFTYEGREIWGATAGILVNLAEVVLELA